MYTENFYSINRVKMYNIEASSSIYRQFSFPACIFYDINSIYE